MVCSSNNFSYLPCVYGFKLLRLGLRVDNVNIEDMEINIFSRKSNMWKSTGMSNYCYFIDGISVIENGVGYVMARKD